jgi:tetratricopeptide (TPR) repeat protein
MKRNVTFALLLIIAVFTLVSCAPSYKSLGKGFDSLTADNPDEAIDNFNYVIDSLPSSSKKKSLAYEGRGWAYYLKGMNDEAEADFLKAGDSIEAKTGLSLVYLCTKNLNDSLDAGMFILDEQDEIIVEYLRDPLTRQEFLKTLAFSAFLVDSNKYENIIAEINDKNFIARIETMKVGE